VRPTTIVLGCGDGGQYVVVSRWSSWTGDRATGEGVYFVNRCTPSCVAGNFMTNRVLLRLSRPRRCSNGRIEFTRLAWHGTPPNARFAGAVRSPWGRLGGVTCP
jgi:hypothetical protein